MGEDQTDRTRLTVTPQFEPSTLTPIPKKPADVRFSRGEVVEFAVGG